MREPDEHIPLKLTDCYHCVGRGWAALLTMLHTELQVVCPDYEALQVKEKFGVMRAYISTPHDSGVNPQQAAARSMAYSLEHHYEALSQYVCENCGKPGENKMDKHRWYRTLCQECRGELENQFGDQDHSHLRNIPEGGLFMMKPAGKSRKTRQLQEEESWKPRRSISRTPIPWS